MGKEGPRLKGKIGPAVVYRLNGQNVVRTLKYFYEQMHAVKARSFHARKIV